MAAKALQQRGALLQRLIHRKTLGGAHRGAQLASALACQQGRWQAKAIHQPGRHDADHAVVPVVLRQQQKGCPLRAIGFQQGQGFGFDRRAQFAPLPIEVLAFPGQFQGPGRVVGGEQFHHQLGIAEPSHRIDARRNLKPHGLGIEGCVIQPGQLLQGLQTHQRTAGQLGQAIE